MQDFIGSVYSTIDYLFVYDTLKVALQNFEKLLYSSVFPKFSKTLIQNQ